ncbi:ABC transporter ATP-binding protein/permease [Methylocapsa acidiphila]|uniref:ABC transporter ATP-binding protein/permease n=1 Tax=Methylocapsa acidiphila TaxID=133552 RepID=UPI0003FC7F4D|nr:ABC transporter ATP-binding protein/permease [Methylocapsa acidiphila]
MKILAAILALFSIATAVIGQRHGDSTVLLLAATALLCAVTTYRSTAISSFLRIFSTIFAVETVLFGVIFLIAQVGLWPASLEDYALPESLPLTVALFSMLVYALSFIPVVRAMTRIADRYFEADDSTRARVWPFPSYGALERRVAIAMVVFLVILNQAQVGIEVRLSFFNRDFFNAIQNKDQATFWAQLLTVFMPWVFIYIASRIVEFIVQSTLIIRWRRWLTENYVGRWLDRHTHYRMSLSGSLADNPDQRISEDINRFIDGGQTGYGIYSFSILLISTLSSLVSFSIVLWELSANFTLPGTSIIVPGFLFWTALIYAGIGTVITHFIGRPLARLAFAQQRYEADFRFSLARLREYGEQIALLSGESAEKASLSSRFSAIITNYFRIVACRKNLIGFTASYGQLSPIIPYLVTAPFYFAGKIQLGVMSQTGRAFATVDSALTFFITYYVALAEYKAVLDRLISFDASIEGVLAAGGLAQSSAAAAPKEPTDVEIRDLVLRLPDGREIVKAASVKLAAREPALFIGPSGSGKSTLFRAISGVWPFGDGSVDFPVGARIMLLPQKPYLPIGTLRAAIAYPAPPDSYDEAAIREALVAASLPDLAGQIHVEDIWSLRLSGGEQQRVAIARALLTKPDWLFLDEATAALDDDMEAKIYETLVKRLPTTTIVSIGHRASLYRFHRRRFQMQPAEKGVFTPVELALAAAE